MNPFITVKVYSCSNKDLTDTVLFTDKILSISPGGDPAYSVIRCTGSNPDFLVLHTREELENMIRGTKTPSNEVRVTPGPVLLTESTDNPDLRERVLRYLEALGRYERDVDKDSWVRLAYCLRELRTAVGHK